MILNFLLSVFEKPNQNKFFALLFLYLLIPKQMIYAQNVADSVYYVSFPGQLTTRIYTSRKYTEFIIRDRVSDNKLKFEPNSTMNLGLGATYNSLTLNLAYGFGFLNPYQGIGKSKYLDLQAHAYPKNLVIDLFLQFYKGYYSDLAEFPTAVDPIILMPNMRARKIGTNVQYLFNGDKISLRAAFLQSEWQKRSGGSSFIGFELYGGNASNDKRFLPQGFLSSEDRNFDLTRFFQFGPNVGYVHTFVILKHFFITGYASTNLSLGQQRLFFEKGSQQKWGISSNLFFRGFVGYNSEKWSINANYVQNRVNMIRNNDFDNSMLTGNYRINFVFRFAPSKKLKSYLDAVDPKRLLLR